MKYSIQGAMVLAERKDGRMGTRDMTDSPRAPGMRLRTAGSTWEAMTALASSTESVMVVRVAVIIWAVARTPIVKSLLHANRTYLSQQHVLNCPAHAGRNRSKSERAHGCHYLGSTSLASLTQCSGHMHPELE